MNEWFREYFELHSTWGRHSSYKVYNPVTGELYVNSALGLASVGVAGFNFFNFMMHQDMIVVVILGIVAVLLGIVGMVLSIMNIPYSFRSKSIFRVIVAFFGLIMSIGGILVSVMTIIIANKLIQAGVV